MLCLASTGSMSRKPTHRKRLGLSAGQGRERPLAKVTNRRYRPSADTPEAEMVSEQRSSVAHVRPNLNRAALLSTSGDPGLVRGGRKVRCIYAVTA
jgi:hypothetical protein